MFLARFMFLLSFPVNADRGEAEIRLHRRVRLFAGHSHALNGRKFFEQCVGDSPRGTLNELVLL